MSAVIRSQYSPAAVLGGQDETTTVVPFIKSNTINYRVAGSTISSLNTNYRLRTELTKSNTNGYQVKEIAQAVSVFNYNILSAGQVSSNTLINYRVRNNIEGLSTFSWHIRSIETKDDTLVYIIQGKLEKSTEDIVYKIYTKASSNLNLDNNLRSLVTKNKGLSYITLGVTQLKKDYFLLYNIISSLPPDWTDVYIQQDSEISVYVRNQDEFVVFIK